MIVALSAVACVMVVIGLGLVVQGTPFTRLEWGWTMVISGTVTATGGALLAGVAVLAAALGRVERALARAGAGTPTIIPAAPIAPAMPDAPVAPSVPAAARAREAAESRAILAADDLPAAPPEPPEPPALRPTMHEAAGEAEANRAAEAPAEPPSVVGTYASGGNAYVMYSDGSIKADTPRGHFTFGSLDELKAFVAEGGEAPEGAEPRAGARA